MTKRLLSAEHEVAVIGVGCWYPDAPTPARLWENVLARRRAFRRIPRQRLSLDRYYDPDKRAPDKTYGRRASLIDGFKFDWLDRRIPRRTFEATDVAHWLALEVSLQALEDAGYGRETLPRDRTGVIVGNSLTGEQSRALSLRMRWPFVERAIRAAALAEGLEATATEALIGSAQSHFQSVFPPVDEDTLAGSLSNTIAGRICNFLDLHGGGYTVDGACASSLLAVTTAASSLCSGDLDVALAGGVDVSLDPFELIGFAKVGALSATEMRVYDRAASGFIPGEGCGFVVLKRLGDARDDGDYVYATVRGWGVSSDGAGGITAPSVNGQALSIRRAYERAGYSPERLHFVEGHGTGTPAGDPVELRAISSAMRSYGATRPRSCGVTSFKSIVGHTKAAAGVGGFIKAAIAVNRRVIPPTSGCVDPNPVFDGDANVLYPLREGRVEPPDSVVRAGVSAMGFGGINTHVTLESGDPPAARLEPSLDERLLLASAQRTELFLLSADSVDALARRVDDVAKRADGASMGELTDLAAELATTLEPDGNVRAAIVAESPDELAAHLGAVGEALRVDPPAPGTTRRCASTKGRAWIANAPSRPRVGFLFPGQGSQQLGMAQRLVHRFDWAKRVVEQSDAWLVDRGHAPISPLIFRPLDRAVDEAEVRAWRHALRQTERAQPAISLANLLWCKYLARLGVTPSVVAGHSLGELSAFFAAGAFDERALIELAALRGQLMSEAQASGTMANLSCAREDAERLIAQAEGYATVANLNAPSQTVVSGDSDTIRRIVQLAKSQSIPAIELNVSGAFHSTHFENAARALRDAERIPDRCAPLHTPMLSAIDGSEIRDGISIRQYLSHQMCARVDFVSVVRAMAERCDLVLEVGPGRVLTGLVKRTVDESELQCLPTETRAGNDEDLNLAVAALFAHGYPVSLDALYENRLYRPFVPAVERKFIENPCERPFPDEDAPAVVPEGRPRQVAESQIVPKLTVHSAVLAAVERQTGFPVESLTLDLRLVDDLHLDSIKTVELVSDVADQLGIVDTFDAAQFAESTLGELIERMELLESSAPARASSDSAAESRNDGEKPWIASFALQWDEAPLLPSVHRAMLHVGRTLLLAPSVGSALVAELAQGLLADGIDVETRDTASVRKSTDAFDHLLVVCPDGVSATDMDALGEVVDTLLAAARTLPSTEGPSEGPRSATWLRVRTERPEVVNHYDWSPDAFAATVHLERRRLVVRSLEVACSDTQANDVANKVLQELVDEQPFRAVRYDANGTRSLAKPRLQDRGMYTPRTTTIGPDDVVLVTGGAKGITAQCALALARVTNATMVLVGSSPAPEAESPGVGEIHGTLTQFANEGLRCHYRQCNLAVRQDVERLVAHVRRDFGAIDVVVHGAGRNHPRRVEEPKHADIIAEIGPKVAGALHLFGALDDAPPKMFVALTSIIGVIGMPHNAWYAFANQSLDRSLGRFAERHPSVVPLSLAYSIWDEVGMGAKLGSIERLGKLGIDAIPVADGVARFVELVTHDPGAREVIVTGRLGGVDTWQPRMPPRPSAHRFLEDIVTFELGAELVCRAHLDLDRDPYVRDHVYEGSHLLPAVFGLEAMAEAVAYLTGRRDLPFPVTIENVELTRPLVVHPERGLSIEIRARVEAEDAHVERGGGGQPGQRVYAEIRSHQTGFERAHFCATFVLGGAFTPREAAVELPGDALRIHPKEHLYGPVLFQGPRFQRIDEVYALDEKRCMFAATQALTEESWLLGDPYFRDALLQSLQLCVVPDQCLPVSIERWEIIEPNAEGPSNRISKAVIDGKENDTYVGTVTSVSATGEPIENIDGYRARALMRRSDWPDARTLAAPRAPVPVHTDAEVTEQAHRVQTLSHYGYQNQDAFTFRFPLTAQDSASATRSLYFTRFFQWMGKMREVCGLNTPGAYVRILDMLRSNEITSATNAFQTRILRAPRCNDIVEGRLWVERVSPTDCDAVCEWWAVPFAPNQGEAQMFGWSHMTISPVQVHRSGAVRGTTWPDYFLGFLKIMGPRGDGASRQPGDPHEYGACRFRETRGPRATGVLLAEESFDTSFEDGNVVGNIYFASYGAWQGRVRDRFFHALYPEAFTGLPDSELVCTNFRMNQLREAMPFDRVRVEMRLMALYDRAADLTFHYFRVAPDGSQTKLAVGEHTAAWASPVATKQPNLKPWPRQILEALFERTGERQPLAS